MGTGTGRVPAAGGTADQVWLVTGRLLLVGSAVGLVLGAVTGTWVSWGTPTYVVAAGSLGAGVGLVVGALAQVGTVGLVVVRRRRGRRLRVPWWQAAVLPTATGTAVAASVASGLDGAAHVPVVVGVLCVVAAASSSGWVFSPVEDRGR